VKSNCDRSYESRDKHAQACVRACVRVNNNVPLNSLFHPRSDVADSQIDDEERLKVNGEVWRVRRTLLPSDLVMLVVFLIVQGCHAALVQWSSRYEYLVSILFFVIVLQVAPLTIRL
jgi:hypothetical protein